MEPQVYDVGGHAMTTPTLIGLTGHAGSGKSSAADILAKYGYTVTHIADPIRRIAYQSLPRIRRVVDAYGWDQAKRIDPEVRPVLQSLGDALRAEFGDDFLISESLCVITGEGVVADVRTDDEAHYVKDCGGTVIEITRTGTKPANGHHLERGIDRDLIDLSIANDGTLEDLETALVTALGLEQKA